MANEKKFLYLGEDGFLKPSTASEAVEITASALTLKLGAGGADTKTGVVHMDSTGLLTSALIVNSDITDGTIETAKIKDANVTADKLGTDSVITAKIQSLAVTTAKLNNGAVTTEKIGDGQVTGAKLASGTIETANIADAAITSAKINDGAVLTAKISDGAVTADKIGAAAVTNAKLGLLSVQTGNIADGNVTTDKINALAVTTAKINDLAVTAAKLGASAVETAKINDLAVTTDKINALAVTTAKINDAAVTTAKINDAAVTTAKINDGAVTKVKLDSAANIAFTDAAQTFSAANTFSASGNSFTQSVAMAGASMTGAINMGASLTASGYNITGLKTGVDYYDAANWGQVQSLVNGIQYKGAAKYYLNMPAAAGASKADIESLLYASGIVSPFAENDRILIVGLTDGESNGLWKFGATELERPDDFASNTSASGAFVFCDQNVGMSGSFPAITFSASALDVAFLCSNTPGSAVIDTNSLTFIKYSGAEALSFTAPLYESNDGLEVELKHFAGLTTEVNGGFTKLRVKVGDGIKIDASEQVALKLNSSEQALSVDGNGLSMALASGNTGLSKSSGLTAVVKSSSGLSIDNDGIQLNLDPSGSLEASVGGEVKVKLNGATLSSSSSGLSVAGLPSQFQINGSGVHAAVSAASLNTLVDGNTSYADQLHAHSLLVAECSADSAISAGIAVYVNSSGKLVAGNCTSAASAKCVGISLGRDGSGSRKQYALSGLVDVSGVLPSGAQPGDVLYMGSDGSPKLWAGVSPNSYVIKLGRLVSTEYLAIAIQDVGIKS